MQIQPSVKEQIAQDPALRVFPGANIIAANCIAIGLEALILTILPVVIDEALKEAMARMKLGPKDKYGLSDSGLGDGFHKRSKGPIPRTQGRKTIADPRSTERDANLEDLPIRPFISKRHSEGLLFTETKTRHVSVPTAVSKRRKATVVPVLPSQPAELRGTPWEQHVDDESGNVYFYNTLTQETTWQHPASTLTTGWSRHTDPETGSTFYYNASTDVTSWELPDEPNKQHVNRMAELALKGNNRVTFELHAHPG